MRLLARWGLRLLTAATSVFIAACYGVPYDGTRGRVVRAGTQDAIPGIDVACLDGVGVVVDRATSGSAGEFRMVEFCRDVAATDVDGDVNGLFAPRTVPVEDAFVLVELSAP